jgi:hypothetical protein
MNYRNFQGIVSSVVLRPPCFTHPTRIAFFKDPNANSCKDFNDVMLIFNLVQVNCGE